MAYETQNTIGKWLMNTFSTSPLVQIKKLEDEVGELRRAIESNNWEHAKEELADVAIVVFGLAFLLGTRLLQRVNQKMIINRQRKWQVTADGTHQHIQ